jgi:hypothetical protein
MPDHQYDAEQALETLMRRLRAKDDSLATHIQAAIDVGKDVTETEPSQDGRKKARVYRKAVPFTRGEALKVALDALQAYFVEQPLFVDSVATNLAKAAVGVPAEHQRIRGGGISEEPETVFVEQAGEEKLVEIELQSEVQLDKSGEATMPLKRKEKSQIEEQQRLITDLRDLVDFTEE